MPNVEIDADAIPEELKERDQWLMWDAAADAPRRPHWAGDFSVSWTDPDAWHSFEAAYETAQERPSWGIGYVFASENDNCPAGVYGALDLDGCLDSPASPKEWLPSLDPFLEAGAYIERSPSGGGLHVPILGFEVPDWWTNQHFTDEEHEGVEAYGKKFFTFTGDCLEPAGNGVVSTTDVDVEQWLKRAYENINGESPDTTPAQPPSGSSHEVTTPREKLEDKTVTSDYDDVMDAVAQLEPRDLRLSSSFVEDENSDVESWNPGYRSSESGKSLKRWKSSGKFVDMQEMEEPFSVLELYAAEQRIINNPYDGLSGDDWHEAVDQARDVGAPIPEYEGGYADEFTETVDDRGEQPSDLTGEEIWHVWSEARTNGELNATNAVPHPALEYIADEKTSYNIDAVPDDRDRLPPRGTQKALDWIRYDWGTDEGLVEYDETEGEYVGEVCANWRPSLDPDEAYTWDAVVQLYDDHSKAGRYAAVRLLREHYHVATLEETDELLVYEPDRGRYSADGRRDIIMDIEANLGSHYTSHERDEILDRLKSSSYHKKEEFDAGRQDGKYLCVTNGVLDLGSRELLDHDPEYLFRTGLDVEYDPDASSAEVETFLDDITRRKEDKQTMLEMLGNCFLPNYRYKGFLVLIGEGSNGKSTWYEVVRQLLGSENVSSMELQQLSENRFSTYELVGRLANIGEDLPERGLANMGTIKNLTGDGEAYAEKKGKQGFTFQNRAKLMFAANRPPALGDRSFAVQRRLLPVFLPNEYVTNPDPDDPNQKPKEYGLEDRLTTEENLSGLLNLALDALDDLRETGEFSLPESPEERLRFYEKHSDPVKHFAHTCLTREEGYEVRKQAVYQVFQHWCDNHDYDRRGPSTFWKQAKTVFSVHEKYRRVDGDREYTLVDARFTEEIAEEVPHDAYIDEPDDKVPDDITPIAGLQEGQTVNITAHCEQVYQDSPDWLGQEGWVVDQTDRCKFELRDDDDEWKLDQGSTYRLDTVRVRKEQGLHVVEVIPNVTEIEKIEAGDALTDEDPDTLTGAITAGEGPSADSEDADADADAATDGGLASDAEAPESVREAAEAITSWLKNAKRPKTEKQVITDLTMSNRYSIAPDTLELGFEKARKEGRISETPDGWTA